MGHVITLVIAHHFWLYTILFLILFLETGVLVAALLPGDSLLILAGSLAARNPGAINIHLLFLLLVTAVVLGSLLNYFTGKLLGPKVFVSRHSWVFNKRQIKKAEQFYKRWGGRFILFACFIPILRTFSPLIAGVGSMNLKKFIIYSLLASIIWISILLYGSYMLDEIPMLKQHLTLIISGFAAIALFTPFIRYFML